MFKPPFKRSLSPLTAASGLSHDCCDAAIPPKPSEPAAHGRTRLAQLDPQLHCSVIGTCLSTAELRKLMARFIVVQGASDLDIHHDAVSMASEGGDASKALHKTLDQRHAGPLRTFAAARDETALAAAWEEACRQGEIPGAYWALLTHRQVTTALRQRAFGEVHMLSHLVGSAHRADLRRLVALERDNAELNERLEREQQRRQELVAERESLSGRLQQQALDFESQLTAMRATLRPTAADAPEAAVVAVQTERRERAEQSAASAWAEAERLQRELEHLRQHALQQGQELEAAENELRQLSADTDPGTDLLAGQLRERCILYVGGRPSSTPAIRDLVLRHGGEFLHHDGGLEVRKGLLAAAVPKADLVVFPVDCVDHDSALHLKRLAERHGIAFIALRKASVASFAAGLLAHATSPAQIGASVPQLCLKHA